MQKTDMKIVSDYDVDTMCCGCSACESACPVNAVHMIPNSKGFWVPQIDEELCVQCGCCAAVCQVGKENTGTVPMMQFGVVNRDDSVRLRSASGGLFLRIAASLAQKYGAQFHCFGAAWDESLNVLHTEAGNLLDCEKFMGSKYVQSNMSHIFRRIRTLLESGQFVLFTGTGCQCAGLRRYLAQCKTNDSNLFVLDLVCHGVPSPGLWRDYIRAVEVEIGNKVVAYQFRNKEKGWRGMHPRAILDDGSDAEESKLFLSYGALFGNLSLNNVCYSCKYAGLKRIGDLTLGDYWGIEHSDCGLDDGKGVSLCLVNTEKGKELFESLVSQLSVYQITDDSYLQPQLRRPTGRNILCDDFWMDYKEKGYTYAAKKYAGHGRAYRAMLKLGAVIRKKF